MIKEFIYFLGTPLQMVKTLVDELRERGVIRGVGSSNGTHNPGASAVGHGAIDNRTNNGNQFLPAESGVSNDGVAVDDNDVWRDEKRGRRPMHSQQPDDEEQLEERLSDNVPRVHSGTGVVDPNHGAVGGYSARRSDAQDNKSESKHGSAPDEEKLSASQSFGSVLRYVSQDGNAPPISPASDQDKRKYLGSKTATFNGAAPTRGDIELLRKARRIAAILSVVLLIALIPTAAVVFNSFASGIAFVLPVFYIGSALIRSICEAIGRRKVGDRFKRYAPQLWQQALYADCSDTAPKVDMSYFKYLALLINCTILCLGMYTQSLITLDGQFVLVGSIITNPIVQMVAIASSVIILFHAIFGWLKPSAPADTPTNKTLAAVVRGRAILAKWLNRGVAVAPADVPAKMREQEAWQEAANFTEDLKNRLRAPNGAAAHPSENHIFEQKELYVQALDFLEDLKRRLSDPSVEANPGEEFLFERRQVYLQVLNFSADLKNRLRDPNGVLNVANSAEEAPIFAHKAAYKQVLDNLAEKGVGSFSAAPKALYEIDEIEDALVALKALFEDPEWVRNIIFYGATEVQVQHFRSDAGPVSETGRKQRNLSKDYYPILDASAANKHPISDDYQSLKEFDAQSGRLSRREWIANNPQLIHKIFSNVAKAEFDPDEKPILNRAEKWGLPIVFGICLIAAAAILYAIFTGHIPVASAVGPMVAAGLLLFSSWFCAEKIRTNSTAGPYMSLVLLFAAVSIVSVTLGFANAVSSSTAFGLNIGGAFDRIIWLIGGGAFVIAAAYGWFVIKGVGESSGYVKKNAFDRAAERQKPLYKNSKIFLRSLNIAVIGLFGFAFTASVFFLFGMSLPGLDLQRWAIEAASVLGGGTFEAMQQWSFMFSVPIAIASLFGLVVSIKSLFEKSVSGVADLEERRRVRNTLFRVFIWALGIGIVSALIALKAGFSFGLQTNLLYPVLGMAFMPILAYGMSFGSLFDSNSERFGKPGVVFGKAARGITAIFNKVLGVEPLGAWETNKHWYFLREMLVLSILMVGAPYLLSWFGVPGLANFNLFTAMSDLSAMKASDLSTITVARETYLFVLIGALVTWVVRLRKIPQYWGMTNGTVEANPLTISVPPTPVPASGFTHDPNAPAPTPAAGPGLEPVPTPASGPVEANPLTISVPPTPVSAPIPEGPAPTPVPVIAPAPMLEGPAPTPASLPEGPDLASPPSSASERKVSHGGAPIFEGDTSDEDSDFSDDGSVTPRSSLGGGGPVREDESRNRPDYSGAPYAELDESKRPLIGSHSLAGVPGAPVAAFPAGDNERPAGVKVPVNFGYKKKKRNPLASPSAGAPVAAFPAGDNERPAGVKVPVNFGYKKKKRKTLTSPLAGAPIADYPAGDNKRSKGVKSPGDFGFTGAEPPTGAILDNAVRAPIASSEPLPGSHITTDFGAMRPEAAPATPAVPAGYDFSAVKGGVGAAHAGQSVSFFGGRPSPVPSAGSEHTVGASNDDKAPAKVVPPVTTSPKAEAPSSR